MRKYLYIGGITPFQNPSMSDVFAGRASLGGNSGNLLFINAMFRTMMTDYDVEFSPTYYRCHFSLKEIAHINETFDAFVLPMADIFRDDTIEYLEGLTEFINHLKIPCYLIGVGLRAPYEPHLEEKRKCDEAVCSFVRAVLRHSSIVGVRGIITGEYLKRKGFIEGRDYEVIGCPSVSALLRPEEIVRGGGYKIRDNKIYFDRGCLITNTLAENRMNHFILSGIGNWELVEVVVQKEMEMEAVYLGNFAGFYKGRIGIPENIFGRNLYEYLNRRRKIFAFTNLESWKQYMSGCDICISTRFHGAVVSIMENVPTLMIPIDSRMRELCEYHQFATVKQTDIDELEIADMLENIKFESYWDVWAENRERYISFLNKNGILHTLNYVKELPFDKMTQKVNWEKAIVNFNELSVWKKLFRVCNYSTGKLYNKIGRICER